jgi:hypothetical protein
VFKSVCKFKRDRRRGETTGLNVHCPCAILRRGATGHVVGG